MKKQTLLLAGVLLCAGCNHDDSGSGVPDAGPPIDATIPTLCNGDCHYVRADATGLADGTDWTNAWATLPETLERGHVYFVADGAYPYYAFDDPEDGDRLIYVVKATQADHGTDTGWEAGLGDGVAQWTEGVLFQRGYYVLDGQRGAGGAVSPEPYGFLFPSFEGTKILIGNKYGAAAAIFDVRHIVLRHLELAGEYPGVPGRSRGIDATASDSVKSEITISDCYIHDESLPFYFIDAAHVVIEHSVIERNASDAESHSEGISCRSCNHFVYRHNRWEDMEGTGIIMHMSGEAAHWQIYGNVFYQTDDPECGGVGHGVVADNGSAIDDVQVHHNTVVGVEGNAGIRFLQGGSGHTAYNNLFYNVDWMTMDNVDYDFTYYASVHFPHAFTAAPNDTPVEQQSDGQYSVITSDPFVDSANGDFRLAAPLTDYPGLALEAPFDSDPDGAVRGADGVWDRGAFEYLQ